MTSSILSKSHYCLYMYMSIHFVEMFSFDPHFGVKPEGVPNCHKDTDFLNVIASINMSLSLDNTCIWWNCLHCYGRKNLRVGLLLNYRPIVTLCTPLSSVSPSCVSPSTFRYQLCLCIYSSSSRRPF